MLIAAAGQGLDGDDVVKPPSTHESSRAGGFKLHALIEKQIEAGNVRQVSRGLYQFKLSLMDHDPKVCPECNHVFAGVGWGGIDAHWREAHETIMPYEKAWPLIQAGAYQKTHVAHDDTMMTKE